MGKIGERGSSPAIKQLKARLRIFMRAAEATNRDHTRSTRYAGGYVNAGIRKKSSSKEELARKRDSQHDCAFQALFHGGF